MSTPHSNLSAFNRLSSLTIARAITAYEQIALSKFAEAEKYKSCIHAAALVVRLNEQGRQNQEKADVLRKVLAQRKAERLARSQFVYKALAAQKLAHAALEGRAV